MPTIPTLDNTNFKTEQPQSNQDPYKNVQAPKQAFGNSAQSLSTGAKALESAGYSIAEIHNKLTRQQDFIKIANVQALNRKVIEEELDKYSKHRGPEMGFSTIEEQAKVSAIVGETLLSNYTNSGLTEDGLQKSLEYRDRDLADFNSRLKRFSDEDTELRIDAMVKNEFTPLIQAAAEDSTTMLGAFDKVEEFLSEESSGVILTTAQQMSFEASAKESIVGSALQPLIDNQQYVEVSKLLKENPELAQYMPKPLLRTLNANMYAINNRLSEREKEQDPSSEAASSESPYGKKLKDVRTQPTPEAARSVIKNHLDKKDKEYYQPLYKDYTAAENKYSMVINSSQMAHDKALESFNIMMGTNYSELTDENIDEILSTNTTASELGSNVIPGVKGIRGWLNAKLPNDGTNTRRNLESIVDFLKSNAALTALKELKGSSPNGASGFGALNAAELKILVDSIGSLDINSSPGEVVKTLARLVESSRKLNEDTFNRMDKLKLSRKGVELDRVRGKRDLYSQSPHLTDDVKRYDEKVAEMTKNLDTINGNNPTTVDDDYGEGNGGSDLNLDNIESYGMVQLNTIYNIHKDALTLEQKLRLSNRVKELKTEKEGR